MHVYSMLCTVQCCTCLKFLSEILPMLPSLQRSHLLPIVRLEAFYWKYWHLSSCYGGKLNKFVVAVVFSRCHDAFMVNGLQIGLGSKPSEWITSMFCVLSCTHSSEALLFFCYRVLDWPVSCSCSSHPDVLLHVFRTCLLLPGNRTITDGIDKSKLELTLRTLPSSLFTHIFQHQFISGLASSNPLRVVLFLLECSFFNACGLHSPVLLCESDQFQFAIQERRDFDF